MPVAPTAAHEECNPPATAASKCAGALVPAFCGCSRGHIESGILWQAATLSQWLGVQPLAPHAGAETEPVPRISLNMCTEFLPRLCFPSAFHDACMMLVLDNIIYQSYQGNALQHV